MKLRIIVAVAALLVAGLYLANPFQAPGWSPISRLTGQQFYRMPNGAMEPAIEQGETFRGCFGVDPSALAVGDVVLFEVPGKNGMIQVKRVAGLGGSTVAIQEFVVAVDGKPIDTWFHSDSNTSDYSREMATVRLPENTVFILGDNLDRSRDSRMYGPVPIKNIVGRLCE